MNNKKNKILKWEIKDVITVVLLSFFLILIQFLVNMVCMANHFVSMVLSIGFTMLLCAPIYYLLLCRVRKHFVTLIYMSIVGMIYMLMGNWYLLPYFVTVGIICEAVLWKDCSERNPKQITVAWVISSLLYNGVNLLPIWFFWETYYSFAKNSGMDQNYIDSYIHYYKTPGWILFIIIFTTVCGLVGSLIGKKIIGKHFKKAGLL